MKGIKKPATGFQAISIQQLAISTPHSVPSKNLGKLSFQQIEDVRWIWNFLMT